MSPVSSSWHPALGSHEGHPDPQQLRSRNSAGFQDTGVMVFLPNPGRLLGDSPVSQTQSEKQSHADSQRESWEVLPSRLLPARSRGPWKGSVSTDHSK